MHRIGISCFSTIHNASVEFEFLLWLQWFVFNSCDHVVSNRKWETISHCDSLVCVTKKKQKTSDPKDQSKKNITTWEKRLHRENSYSNNEFVRASIDVSEYWCLLCCWMVHFCFVCFLNEKTRNEWEKSVYMKASQTWFCKFYRVFLCQMSYRVFLCLFVCLFYSVKTDFKDDQTSNEWNEIYMKQFTSIANQVDILYVFKFIYIFRESKSIQFLTPFTILTSLPSQPANRQTSKQTNQQTKKYYDNNDW